MVSLVLSFSTSNYYNALEINNLLLILLKNTLTIIFDRKSRIKHFYLIKYVEGGQKWI